MNAKAAKRIRREAVYQDPQRKEAGIIARLKREHYRLTRWEHLGPVPVIEVPAPRFKPRGNYADKLRRKEDYVFGKPYWLSRVFVRGQPDKNSPMYKRLMTQEWQRMRRLKKKGKS